MIGPCPAFAPAGSRVPEIVGTLRLDQPWARAQESAGDSLATVRRDLPITPAKAGVCTSKFEIKVIGASAGRCQDCTRRPSQTGERSIVERSPAVRDRD